MESREPADLNFKVGKPLTRKDTKAGRSFSVASILNKMREIKGHHKNGNAHDQSVLGISEAVSKGIPGWFQALQ